MNATLILVMAEDCGGCVMFKKSFKKNLIESYEKKGVDILERNILSMRTGPTEKEIHSHFLLRYVRYYPFIALVRTDVLEGDYSEEDICSSLFVYNGKVSHTTNGILISSINPGVYGASTEEFKRYLNDFSNSKKYLKLIKRSKDVKERISSVQPPSSFKVTRKYNCQRIAAIPYVKK